MTTLEWLLVVAAVAGLAAVAVVLVQRVVGGTAEQIESHSARQEAAELAALELTQRWLAKTPDSLQDADDINRDYSQKCRTLGIIYGDIDLNPQPAPGERQSGRRFLGALHHQHPRVGGISQVVERRWRGRRAVEGVDPVVEADVAEVDGRDPVLRVELEAVGHARKAGRLVGLEDYAVESP